MPPDRYHGGSLLLQFPQRKSFPAIEQSEQPGRPPPRASSAKNFQGYLTRPTDINAPGVGAGVGAFAHAGGIRVPAPNKPPTRRQASPPTRQPPQPHAHRQDGMRGSRVPDTRFRRSGRFGPGGAPALRLVPCLHLHFWWVGPRRLRRVERRYRGEANADQRTAPELRLARAAAFAN